MVRLRSSLVSVWLLALLLVAASAARAQGPNWELYTVPADSGTGGPTSQSGPPPVVTNHLYFLHNEAGIYESPLPDFIKEDLHPLEAEPSGGGISISIEDGGEEVYVVSQEIVDEIVASENAGVLTPGIEAISEPLDEETSSSYSSGVVVGNSIFGGSCATKQQTIHRVINLTDKTYTKNFPNLGNGFSGSLSLNGQITGTVTTDLTLDIKRRNTLGKCVPYSVRFKNLHAFGNATSTGGITLTGTLNYSDTFGPWQLANPELFDYWTVIWYIPVRIVGTLPITAGLGVTGNVTGTINYNGNHVATGNLDYNCTLSDCTGTNSFNNSPDNLDQQITGGITGHVKPDAWVDASFRVSLYSSGFANAQVGVRGHLLGDLWGFDGNNCGDADGANGNETVRALTFDLDRRIDILGKAEVFSSNVWDHAISNGQVKHVGFYDVINNSTAMQPQFQGPPSLFVGDPGTYKVKMRPCWPYTDNVTYQLNWGDGGAVEDLQGAPGTELTPSHTWSAAGIKTASATSVRDAHGRALNQSTTRALEVKAITPLGVTVTPAPASSTYGNPINLTATVTGGHTPTVQYTLGRRRVGTVDWIPMPLVWQAGNVLSWTPTAADVGSWELAIAVKDRTTAPDANGLGYAAAAIAGTVQVVAPLVLSCPTVVQRTVTSGTTFTWSGISSTGGTPGTVEYSYSRQLTGNASNPWLPNPLVWQTNTAFSWTPTASDLGTWQFFAITRDVNTPANPGYSSTCNMGQIVVVSPLTVSVTPSPATSIHGTAITWTATANGGIPASTQYAFFRRRAGDAVWTPPVTQAVWQGSSYTWTPGAADVGTWEIVVWVKDGNTPSNANTYGYASYANAGSVNVVTPPLTLSVTASPTQIIYGNPISWQATATGGTPATTRFAFFRRPAGTTPWTPDATAPAWQTSNTFTWTPTSADVNTWEIYVWVKDGDTPATMNTYGYAVGRGAGNVNVVNPPPLTLSATVSPAQVVYGNPFTWTATASGGTPATIKYAFFRRRSGTTPWTPDATAPVWQTSNTFTWTPTSADVGTWDTFVWVKDGNTPASMNTYGYAASANTGPVKVVTPPLTLTATASPSTSYYGITLNWTATAGGGTPATTQYALFRRLAGTTTWTPAVTTPAWQTSPNLSWTPSPADVGTWEIGIWVKDGDTPSTQNTYGYAASYNPGTAQIVAPPTLSVTGSPASVNYGTPITWTASSSSSNPASVRYAFFRRRSGTTPWTPAVTSPNWQASNTFTWTPTSADAGTWDTYVWVKDAYTPASMNTYGYAAGYNTGGVRVVAPLSGLTCSGNPSGGYTGTTFNWSANASGGDSATLRYALFRRRVGSSTWVPAQSSPSWQTSSSFSWSTLSLDAGSYDIVIWAKDGNTPANANTYGYAVSCSPGTIQVITPPTVTGTTSPSTSPYGATISWTATASGGDASSMRYAIFRRRAGTSAWTPDVTNPSWQSGRTFSWTPTSADVGTWEVFIWIKDAYTPSNMNTYGHAAWYNAGNVDVTTPAPVTVTGTGSPSTSPAGTTISWTATASGGVPGTYQYAFFRKRAGASTWTPDVTAANWQSSRTMTWTPSAADVGTWEIIIWVKDVNTSPTQGTYGFAAYYNAQPVQVY
jgi:hypothetical protein